MRVIRNRPRADGPAYVTGRCAVAVGNFDGVHLGHQELLRLCNDLAGDEDSVAVVTFEPLPLMFFSPEKSPARITSIYRKLQLLAHDGVDATWLMRFDRSLAGLTPEEFAHRVLHVGLNARHVVVGDDFRFGRGRSGGVGRLSELGREMGFGVTIVPAVTLDGERISSSRIRNHLVNADFAGAERLLGRPFHMEGHVVYGAGLGRKLGYPTANLRIRQEQCPLTGVLAAWSRIDGGPWLPAVVNLGRRPAVGGGEPLLEVHFFDFDEDIYGQRLEVEFVAKLRDELDFKRLDDLVEQMKRDDVQARGILATAPRPQ